MKLPLVSYCVWGEGGTASPSLCEFGQAAGAAPRAGTEVWGSFCPRGAGAGLSTALLLPRALSVLGPDPDAHPGLWHNWPRGRSSWINA